MKTKILIVAYGLVCAVLSFAVVQCNTKRAQKEMESAWSEADKARDEVAALEAENARLIDVARRTNEAIERASNAVQEAREAHDARAETIRSTDRAWLEQPVPDSLRDLFCGGSDGTDNPANGASGAMCTADGSSDNHE